MPRPPALRPRLAPAALATVALTALAAPFAEPAPPVTEPELRTVAAVDRGYDRLGIRRGERWYLRDSLDGGPARTYTEESGGWEPVAGDFDGDGTATVSLFRDGIWLIRNAERGPRQLHSFGLKGDKPVVGDWDGDGVDTMGVLRGGRWYLRDAPGGGPNRSFGFGVPGDVPVAGDWDGDGDDDIAVVRGRTWYQRDAADGGPASRSFAYGLAGDLPVAGDWDHDLRDTPGVFRDGTWYLRRSDGRTTYARLGQAGDRPVVRRVPGLAPGVTHRVVRYGGSVAHVVEVDLAATSTPDVVLAGNRLRGLETTSSMAQRSGAAVAVNGDYALSNGRPVHALALDGRLQQTDQAGGKGMGIGLAGTPVTLGQHTTPIDLRPQAAAVDHPVFSWNGGQAQADDLVAFTAAGAGLETPRGESCYAGVAPATSPEVLADGRVAETLTVTGTRCGGPPPAVPTTGGVLTGNRFTGGEDFISTLKRDEAVRLLTTLGFPGAVDLIGGNPMLVVDGAVNSRDVDGSGGYFGANPRTFVATTKDGRLLLVVVDGRQSGHSEGLTLRETAELARLLGADDALNLDGGGSSTLFLNGQVANRPSDGDERPVSSAVVLLPGADAGEASVTAAPVVPAPVPARALWKRIASDPGSTGGLIASTADRDPLLRASLRRSG